MRDAICIVLGWIVGFSFLALGAGWFAPMAGFAATFAAMRTSH
jgi:hypothetical protein